MTGTSVVLTSVDPGNIASLALILAPLASWISLILLPPLPMLHNTPCHRLTSVRTTCYLHASHTRVRNDELDGNRTRTRQGRRLEWFVIDPSNNQSKRLVNRKH